MTHSPGKQPPHLPPSSLHNQQLTSPRSTRTLRKLQSAHALSSNYAALNTPSLISQQRHEQQHRNGKSSYNAAIPDVPPIPQLRAHQRTRSNSDAVAADVASGVASPRRLVRKGAKYQSPKEELAWLVRAGPQGDPAEGLSLLRYLILVDGLDSDNDGMSQLRIYVWLILLNAPPIPTDAYLDLIHRGPSPAYSKIRNDTFRTLATDPLFKRRVSEASLIRLLNAVAWRLHDAKHGRISEHGKTTNAATELGSPQLQQASPAVKHTREASTITTEGSDAGGTEPGIYVQGMNVLCAPFLYVARSEAEAFVAFLNFITRQCPGYARGAMDGVHKGLALVDRCLSIVDPKLSAYLLSKHMTAEIYAFASVLTMCACTPPLPEVLQLWDFLLAHGPHLNILCICAQLTMMRDNLMSSPSPVKILRSFPPLQAKNIISYAVNMVRKIPPNVYEELVHHAE